MKITLENVEELMAQTNLSYDNAKNLLMETGGDVLQAIHIAKDHEESFSLPTEVQSKEDFKKSESSNQNPKENETLENMKEFMKMNIGIFKDSKKIFKAPVWMLILFTLVFCQLMVPVAIITALLTTIGPYDLKILNNPYQHE